MSRRKRGESNRHVSPQGDGTYRFDVEAIPNYDATAEMVVRCQACRYRLLVIACDVHSVTGRVDEGWMADPDLEWFRPMVHINTEGLFGQSWPADQLFEEFGTGGTIGDLECPKCGVSEIRFAWSRRKVQLLDLWRDAEKSRESRRVVVDC